MPTLLQVEGLEKSFTIGGRKKLKALRGIDLEVHSKQIMGLVGESGSGKSTLGRSVLLLEQPDAGKIIFEGTEITSLSRRELRPYRRRMQIIFQDPFAALDPRLTVRDIVTEPLAAFGLVRGQRQLRDEAARLLTEVGLPEDASSHFPHEFSGGQRQRIGIARALALRPRFLVADEPVSALDISVQSQIINLLADLQRREGLSFLFISHDLRLVLHLCHRIAVIYLGRIVEEAPARRLETVPSHPYTRALLATLPEPGFLSRQRRTLLGGEPPNPISPPSGCPFHPRCPLYAERKNQACLEILPQLEAIEPGHFAACHEVHPTVTVTLASVGKDG